MIGQDSLLSRLRDEVSNHKVFGSLLFVGPRGCGRHTLATILSDLVGYKLIDITDKIEYEFLSGLYIDVAPKICLVDLDLISISSQNMLLKTLEETPEGCHFCLLTESRSSVLDTIIGRCSLYEFIPYTEDQLRLFLKNENTGVLPFCKTPGDVISFSPNQIQPLVGFVKKVFDKIGLANHSNILHICDFVNWGENPDDSLFCAELFFRVLRSVSYDLYKDTLSDFSYELYELTLRLMKDLRVPHINKRRAFEKYLLEMRCVYDNAKSVEG